MASVKFSVIFLLVGVSITLALFFLAVFVWSVKDGQFEDDYTPSVRILFEDELVSNKSIDKKQNINQ